jgi:ubiquitin-protein ligase
VLEGPPSTPYSGGCFRVKLVLSKDYPVSPVQLQIVSYYEMFKCARIE